MGNQDDELYVRWLQYGVFSPINRLHSTCNDYMGKEPWKRSFAACTVAENILRLRHKLIPYIHSANYKTHLEGTPICAPMYYFYDQEEAYLVPNQYLFGLQLLVAPITKPANKQLNYGSVKVWLPEGRWTDIFTNQIYQGGQWVTMHRDLDSIPVLAPSGAIVPMYLHADTNDLSVDQALEIHIWRGNGSFDLYDDRGEYAYSVTRMTLKEQGERIQFTIHALEGDVSVLPEIRKVLLKFRDISCADISVNGISTKKASNQVELSLEKKEVCVELSNIRFIRNYNKDELRTNLLTRVQWNNLRKNQMFKEGKWDKLPGYLKDALAEIDALE